MNTAYYFTIRSHVYKRVIQSLFVRKFVFYHSIKCSRMYDYNQEIFSNHEDKTTNKQNNLGRDLKKSINKIIQNEGYITHSIFVRDISTEGGNYMSLLKEVDIKGKTANNVKETNLFIKMCLPDGEQDILSTEELFLKEVFFYTEVAELFNELQNEFNVPDNEKINFVKYYGDGSNNSLIFDNMTRKGFKIYDRFDVPPLKIMEQSVKQLAKFHGLSMVLKQYRPVFYKNKIPTLKHPFSFDEDHKIFITSLFNISIKCLDDDKKVKIENLVPEMYNKLRDYVNINESKVKCLCDGDYRMNNILVKEKNGEAAEVIPIDYQTIYYGCPVIDLLFYIFLTTDRKVRKDHMEDLKDIYFESLKTFLRYFNIDVESVYPQKDFEDDFKSQLEYGLIVSLFLLPLVLAPVDDIPELKLDMKEMKLHDNFKTRIKEVVDDFIEWGYL